MYICENMQYCYEIFIDFHEICTCFREICMFHEIFEKDRTTDAGFPQCDTIGRGRARP